MGGNCERGESMTGEEEQGEQHREVHSIMPGDKYRSGKWEAGYGGR